MLGFKGMLLVSAMAVLASSAFAMESMDDSAMSDAVGQDGIDIYANLNIGAAGTTVLTYTDTNGFASTPSYAFSGDLNIRGFKVVGTVKTTIDVGSTTAGPQSALQIGISSALLTTTIGSIDVCKTPGAGICAAGTSVITMPVGGVAIAVTNFNLNLQLGNSPQGHMGLLSSTAPIAITIGSGAANQVIVKDANNTNGGIGIGQLALTGIDLGDGTTVAKSTFIDMCSSTVTVNCGGVAAPGLLISFGATTMNNVGVTITKLTLGDTSATPSNPIGNVTLTNLDLSGTSVRIVGHN
ncbi:MAG: hypothetical protein PSX71_14550 [bacterium]|nr:hypothetical protein [bacterium]